MIRFTTESGSAYEADLDNWQIRRMSGVRSPTPHQGPDGQWQSYIGLNVNRHENAEIIWRIDYTDDGPVARRTVTSPVKTIGGDCYGVGQQTLEVREFRARLLAAALEGP